MKTVKMLLALVLAMGLVLCFAACGGEEAGKETTPVTTTPVTTETPTEASVETEPQNPVYTVTVVDEMGDPVANAMVQLCNEACYPGSTNEEGVATFALEEAEYKVSFLSIPDGYALVGETEEFYFDQGSMELTITLQKLG